MGLPFGAYANGFSEISSLPLPDAVAAPDYTHRHDLSPEKYTAFVMEWVGPGRHHRRRLLRGWPRPYPPPCGQPESGRPQHRMIPDFIYNPPDVPLDILYQDAQIIVVNKPAGLLSVPGKLEGREDCLISRLQAAHWDTLLVHRLDCDTSGVMIFARTKQAQGFLGQEFEKRRAKKTYIAEVYGQLTPDQGHIDLPLCADWPNRPRQMVDHTHGRPAQTDWQVI